MNESQRQVIYGTMLGDAHIRFPAPRSRNAHLRINHCMKQLGYLEFLCKMLKPYSRKIKYQEMKSSIVNGHLVSDHKVCYFYTVSSPIFTNLHRLFYTDSVKVIPEMVMQSLNWQGLAIWIADDGTYLHNNLRSSSDDICICSECFTEKENLMAISALKRKFMLHCWYSKRGNRIHINNNSLYRLRNYAMPFIPKQMWYKFGVDGFSGCKSQEEKQRTWNDYCNIKGGRDINKSCGEHK